MFTFDPLRRTPRIHFCGIGGTAMVAGARLAIEAGWEVRGSDNPLYPPTSEMVKDLGVPVATGYGPANLDWRPDVVVIGNALSRGNAEVEAVLDRKLRYVSLPEWLKEAVLRERRPVVVSGTHGKTTTTALTAFVLRESGMDCGYLIGGQPQDFTHSAHLGRPGCPFVIEGDEYDTAFFDKRAKFFHYLPEMAVVTSMEFDHGDIYRDVAEIERAFQLMLRQIPRSGWLILCADHPRVVALKDHAFCHVTTYGLSETADWRGVVGFAAGYGSMRLLTVYRSGEKWAQFAMPLAGEHNVQNTLAALAVAGLLGLKPALIEQALPRFRGVRRRMEVFLEAKGITFVDDFAHHPTALRATINAARDYWPQRRLWALVEPRSNTMVTHCFQSDLAHALGSADIVWIGAIHRADQLPPHARLDREALTEQLKTGGGEAHYTDDVGEIVRDVRNRAQEGDVVLILSNGAFGGIYERFRQVFGT